MSDRLKFDEIDSIGTFPDGRIKMDVIFTDSRGREYVWTPKWEELQKVYVSAEQVEELNTEGGEHLERLKAVQKFGDETLARLAKCIAYHKSLDGLRKEFDGRNTKASQTPEREEINRIFESADIPSPNYPDKYTLANRDKIIHQHLRDLNEDDYENVVVVMESLVDRRRHIDAEERRREIIEEMNKILGYENLMITIEGRVRPINAESEE
ncbi:hypothetical protein [Halorubellus salinus]|uniref:hypothetical protein n=1 Tax=Halorubellus salinus TaxID=755309 RepID=UPI001D067B83|nr:hypothetical protein [Halorubellus salinus]